MQIVIDIPKDLVEGAKSNPNYYPLYLFEIIWKAIVNSTPLPKGHGRLKDVDHYTRMAWEHPDYSLMDDEPTIIEADKEAQE